MPAVTPGTTSNVDARPRAARCASSPPRPKTNGSPPFSRTTTLPGARVLDEQPLGLLLRHLRPAADLADVDELGVRRGA